MNIATINNIKYDIYPLGMMIRGSIHDLRIFRIRPGNGFYGSIEGQLYQDQYNYFIPSSINNAESEPYRVQLKAAVKVWQTVLSIEEKIQYNNRANLIRGLSGYNLLIREAMKGIYSMYVDRGDPANYDFDKTDLTTDGAWHELDLSAIITEQAKAVLIAVATKGGATGWNIVLKKNGNSNNINHASVQTKLVATTENGSIIVSPDIDRKIEYRIDNQAWTLIKMGVRGWWT